MRFAFPALLAALLLPATGSASTLAFEVTGGELSVDFGLVRFTLFEDAESLDFDVSGVADLDSGPLYLHDVDDVFGDTTYGYGAGTLVLSLQGFDDDGNFVSGTFTAETEPFSFTVCEGCDTLFGGGTADDFEIDLGRGVLDPALAKLFGVNVKTLGGFIDFGLEDIDGDPFERFRTGYDHRGYANLEIVAQAPEPGFTWLLIAGGAGLAARRRSGRR
jgi:hypothetical protein